MCRYSPSSLYVELSRNDQPRFPSQHLFWSSTAIIFNGAEIRMAEDLASNGRHKLPTGGTQQRSDDLIPEDVAFFSPSSVSEGDGWWDMRQCCQGSGSVRALWLTLAPQIDRRIANTVDSEGWKRRWMTGKNRGRCSEREVNKRWKLWEESCLKMTRKNKRQEGRGVRDVGRAAYGPLGG